MDYLSFVKKAKSYDKRNTFSEYSGDLSFVPENMMNFYYLYNPVDVEVSINGGIIRFISAEDLMTVKKEYPQLDNAFVFATNNGDPIFLYEGAVYTCAHGTDKTQWEKLSESLEKYLAAIE